MSTVRDLNFLAIQIYLAARLGTESFRLSFRDSLPGRWDLILQTRWGECSIEDAKVETPVMEVVNELLFRAGYCPQKLAPPPATELDVFAPYVAIADAGALDRFGEVVGLRRRPAETDEKYRARLGEVFCTKKPAKEWKVNPDQPIAVDGRKEMEQENCRLRDECGALKNENTRLLADLKRAEMRAEDWERKYKYVVGPTKKGLR